MTANRDPGVPRSIYIEPIWKLPRSYDFLIGQPPAGYVFTAPVSRQERFIRALSRSDLSYRLLLTADRVVPSMLLMASWQRRQRPPPGTVLTYAHGHLVRRVEPWVVEVEYASLLLSNNVHHLFLLRRTLEKALASANCRKIRCWSESGRRSLTDVLDCTGFEHKIEVIYPAIPARPFTKEHRDGPVKLLFVGSANIKGEFAVRGGWDVLELMPLLGRRYPDLELVIRSDVPDAARRRISEIPNVRLIDKVIPWVELEHEFRTADIFLLPTHSTPGYGLLDPMSFELPVVSIDAWANGEFVEDGRTGLLARPSSRIPYFFRNTRHPSFGTPSFYRAIEHPDLAVVAELAEKVSVLIDNPDLRRQMGRAGRWDVEHGRLSIESRNKGLARMFDEALAGDWSLI